MSEFISTSKSVNAQAHAPIFGEPISLAALRAAYGPFDVVKVGESRFVKSINDDGTVGDTLAFVSRKCDTSKPMHVVNALLWSEPEECQGTSSWTTKISSARRHLRAGSPLSG